MSSIKRQLPVFLAVIAGLVLLYTTWATYGSSKAAEGNQHEGIIRFHVIANSNSEEDQKLKLAVRDKVLSQVNENLVRETMLQHDGGGEARLTLEESRAYIKKNLAEIETIAESVIREYGLTYKANADLDVCWIPEKRYGDITYPAGNYEALNIRLGEAEGENWWCVLFPPLCLIDTQTASGTAITMDGINVNAGADMEVPQQGVKLKFKTIEIIDSIKKD